MNNKELAQKALNVARNYNTAYVWGTFGLVANGANMQRMINQYSKNTKYLNKARQIYGNGYFFDCVGLIKGLLWGWCGNPNKTYGGAGYASNGVPDISADQMITQCKDVSTDFSKIVVGAAVWLPGHIGIYVGDGKVVEATPSFNNGVQITACGNIGGISGLNTRKWTKHGKIPWVSYSAVTPTAADTLTDIHGHYAEKHIKKLIHYGIISGYEDNTFRPDNPVTRGEFSVMTERALTKACGYNLKKSHAFSDIDGYYGAESIDKITACGIVNGYEDGTFRPNTNITRGQAAMITANFLYYCGVKAKTAAKTFPDTVNHYADRHIQTLIAYGVVNGYEDGTFKPDINVTRGQAAIMLANALTIVGK